MSAYASDPDCPACAGTTTLTLPTGPDGAAEVHACPFCADDDGAIVRDGRQVDLEEWLRDG